MFVLGDENVSEVIIAIHELTDKLFPGDSDFEGKQDITCFLSLHNYKCQFDMNLVKLSIILHVFSIPNTPEKQL